MTGAVLLVAWLETANDFAPTAAGGPYSATVERHETMEACQERLALWKREGLRQLYPVRFFHGFCIREGAAVEEGNR